jgi:hypothetical protein
VAHPLCDFSSIGMSSHPSVPVLTTAPLRQTWTKEPRHLRRTGSQNPRHVLRHMALSGFPVGLFLFLIHTDRTETSGSRAMA